MAMVLDVLVSRPINTLPIEIIRLPLRRGSAGQGPWGSAALRLSPQNRMRLAALPAGALEFWDQMFLTWKANAEVGDERPGRWNVERLGDRARIEDGHPADAKATDARGEPECVQGADRRIAARLRHGARAEAMAVLGRLVTKHRKLYRRVVEARKLELGVKRRPFVGIGAERVTVGRLEIRPDGRAARLVVNAHEASRLAIAHRRRERREVEEIGQRRLIRRLRAEMADIPPPRQKLGEGCLERGVKLRRFAEGLGQFRHRHSFVPERSVPARLA